MRLIAFEEYVWKRYADRIRELCVEDAEIVAGSEKLERNIYWSDERDTVGGYLDYSAVVRSEWQEPSLVRQKIGFWAFFDDDSVEIDLDLYPYCVFEEHKVYLDRFFAPMLTMPQIRDAASDMLCRYNSFGDAPDGLARRMGLTVVEAPLVGMNTRPTLLVYTDTELKVRTIPSSRLFEQDTIIKNVNCTDYYRMAALGTMHECFHYDVQHLFITLQRIASMAYPEFAELEPCTDQDNTLSFIEQQAHCGADFLLYPQEYAIEDKEKYLDLTLTGDRNYGDCYDLAIRTIAAERALSVSLVRRVFLKMGWTAAKGACNYQDGYYLDPYSFDTKECKGGYRYDISLADLMPLFAKNDKLYWAMSNGILVYVNGHVCVNAPEYVEEDICGLRLTRRALKRLDLCCIRFKVTYTMTPHGTLHGTLACDDADITVKSSCSDVLGREYGLISYIFDELNRVHDLPFSFAETLRKHRDEVEMTREQLSEAIGVDESTISRLETGRTTNYDLAIVIRLAKALELPLPFVKDLLAKANYVPGFTPGGRAIEYILGEWDKITMDHVDSIAAQYKAICSTGSKLAAQAALKSVRKIRS